jgi:acetyl-CoA acetyltransferase
MSGRGPYDEDAVLASPKIADPFHLLHLCMVSEGAAALIVTSADVSRGTGRPGVRVLAGGAEWLQQQYVNAPVFEPSYNLGRELSDRMFDEAEVTREDVRLLQLYDANVFEVIRQVEVLGMAPRGQGAAYLRSRGIGPGSDLAPNTDGGLLSFSHPGFPGPTIKVVEAVRQLRGEAATHPVAGHELAIVTGAGSGAQYWNAAVLAGPR